MSNHSILQRLEQGLEKYEAGQLSRNEFVRFLSSSIEALEGIPYRILIELRQHERAIETEGYFEEEGFQSENIDAKNALKNWIIVLQQEYPAIMK